MVAQEIGKSKCRASVVIAKAGDAVTGDASDQIATLAFAGRVLSPGMTIESLAIRPARPLSAL